MSAAKNIVGPQVRKLRCSRGMTQDALAAACQRLEFDLSRGTLSKIEAKLRRVTDKELLMLSKVLKTPLQSLFPAEMIKGSK